MRLNDVSPTHASDCTTSAGTLAHTRLWRGAVSYWRSLSQASDTNSCVRSINDLTILLMHCVYTSSITSDVTVNRLLTTTLCRSYLHVLHWTHWLMLSIIQIWHLTHVSTAWRDCDMSKCIRHVNCSHKRLANFDEYNCLDYAKSRNVLCVMYVFATLTRFLRGFSCAIMFLGRPQLQALCRCVHG